MNIKIFKKSQIIVISLVVILMTIGYLNYESKTVETLSQLEENRSSDVQLVSSISTENINSEVSIVSNENTEESINNNEEKETSATEATSNIQENEDSSLDYFVSTKMERDAMYSQMIETYQKMIDSASISSEQKAIAVQEINKIENTKNAIMISENLIKSKGFEDVAILINDESVNIIVKKSKLTVPEVSQIQNIISRELDVEIRKYTYTK